MDKTKEMLTSQLIVGEIKACQLPQFADSLRNFAYKKPSQNSVIKEVVDWSTTSDLAEGHPCNSIG